MKTNRMKILSLLMLGFIWVLAACGNDQVADPENQAEIPSETLMNTGTFYLMVNPEIAIDYDEAGLVTNIRGANPDGEEIIEAYSDYIGKSSGQVVEELILLLGDLGYFVEEVEGESKSIVIELEAGSALPGDNFLEKMAASAQRAVEYYRTHADENAKPAESGEEITVSSEPTSSPATVSYADNTLISYDEAKRLAYEHAGVNAEQVIIDDLGLDSDDGVPIYELEFHVGPDEYDYEIHGLTGEVLDFEQDIESGGAGVDSSEMISLDAAKQIAFDHAGVDGTQARFDDQEWEEDDGIPYYSLEFEIGEDEYEYEIHAVTGEILDYDIDLD